MEEVQACNSVYGTHICDENNGHDGSHVCRCGTAWVNKGMDVRPGDSANAPRGPQNVLRALSPDPATRKAAPITSGVLDYFPLAVEYISRVSKAGNDQHNPGQPLHWARGKSSDHADCIARHLIERGTMDTDNLRHTGKLAWRALALLQEELEAAAGFVPEVEK